jgi:glucose-6-phosphate isomerase
MYREVSRNKTDRTWMQSHSIRYDITVIPPANLDGEYVKTKGHYHPENPAGTGYPELYEVMDGIAHFLLQTKNLDDVILIEAHKDDIIAIPPRYGHVTINPTLCQTLTMANLVSTAFSSEYAGYDEMHGAAYYELTGGIVKKNPAYPQVAPVRRNSRSILSDFGNGTTLYDFVGNDRIAQLLNHPEDFAGFFAQNRGGL